MIERFPQYQALNRNKYRLPIRRAICSPRQELQEIIFWFYLAHFDPDFLRGPVTLPGGVVCDLSDLVEEEGNGDVPAASVP